MLRFSSVSFVLFKIVINYGPKVALSRQRLEREAKLSMNGYIWSNLLAVHPKYINSNPD